MTSCCFSAEILFSIVCCLPLLFQERVTFGEICVTNFWPISICFFPRSLGISKFGIPSIFVEFRFLCLLHPSEDGVTRGFRCRPGWSCRSKRNFRRRWVWNVGYQHLRVYIYIYVIVTDMTCNACSYLFESSANSASSPKFLSTTVLT